MSTWFIIIGMGLVTFAIRMSFILMPPDARVPPLLKRSLVYIAAAVLPALIMPDVLFRGNVEPWGFDPLRLVAALIAGVIAWKTRSIFATLGGGMAVLLLLRYVLHS